MILEHIGLSQINGSLVVLDGVKGVQFDEMAELHLDDGSTRVGRVVQVEGDRCIIQVFEGTVIAKKHGGIEETVTVRRVSYGIGVEKVFPVHSPSIDHFEVVRNGKVRRAKLYYLRGRVGKGAKVKEKL